MTLLKYYVIVHFKDCRGGQNGVDIKVDLFRLRVKNYTKLNLVSLICISL